MDKVSSENHSFTDVQCCWFFLQPQLLTLTEDKSFQVKVKLFICKLEMFLDASQYKGELGLSCNMYSRHIGFARLLIYKHRCNLWTLQPCQGQTVGYNLISHKIYHVGHLDLGYFPMVNKIRLFLPDLADFAWCWSCIGEEVPPTGLSCLVSNSAGFGS